MLDEELNEHFEAINGRAGTTGHYWADNSRNFLQLAWTASSMGSMTATLASVATEGSGGGT